MKKLKKPKLEHQNKPAYDWNRVRDWIEKKTGKEVRNWKGHKYGGDDNDPNNPPYCDFWHWLTDRYEIHNGCYIYLTCQPGERYIAPGEEWVNEVLDVIHAEFPEANGELYCYVSW